VRAHCKKLPKVGQVVAIYDTEMKLGGRLDVIKEIIYSTDGVVRNAKVKTTLPGKVSLTKNFKIVEKLRLLIILFH